MDHEEHEEHEDGMGGCSDEATNGWRVASSHESPPLGLLKNLNVTKLKEGFKRSLL